MEGRWPRAIKHYKGTRGRFLNRGCKRMARSDIACTKQAQQSCTVVARQLGVCTSEWLRVVQPTGSPVLRRLPRILREARVRHLAKGRAHAVLFVRVKRHLDDCAQYSAVFRNRSTKRESHQNKERLNYTCTSSCIVQYVTENAPNLCAYVCDGGFILCVPRNVVKHRGPGIGT